MSLNMILVEDLTGLLQSGSTWCILSAWGDANYVIAAKTCQVWYH